MTHYIQSSIIVDKNWLRYQLHLLRIQIILGRKLG
jgi:hypothetical protein